MKKKSDIGNAFKNKMMFTISGDFVQGYVVLVGHVAEEGEDHKAREEARQRVDGAGDDRIPGSQFKKEENK